MKITLTKKNRDMMTVDSVKNIEVLDTYLIINSSLNKSDTILLLDNVSEITIGNSDYFVFTGKEYSSEMKVDYQDFCTRSQLLPYEELSENDEWNAKKMENKPYVICTGELDIIPEKLCFS